MHRALNALALYVLAMVACGKTTEDPGSDGGSGGRAGAGRGTGGAGKSGSLGTGGMRSGSGGTAGMTGRGVVDAGSGGARACEGQGDPRGSGGGPAHSRYEQTSCYVADAVRGRPNCLPVSNPMLVQRLYDQNNSCAFAPEFVIEASNDVPVPLACESVLACCASSPQSYQQQACYDTVEALAEGAAPVALACDVASAVQRFMCTDAGSNEGDSDAGASSVSDSHALCCYRTCGFLACI